MRIPPLRRGHCPLYFLEVKTAIVINPATKESASKNVQPFYKQVDGGRGVACGHRHSVIPEFLCRSLLLTGDATPVQQAMHHL